MSGTIMPEARLIAALVENIHEMDWASDILDKCGQIEKALEEIRNIAISRQGGEQ